ncbi:MAG: hypothetical protein ACRDGE_10420 [Candidatus Limnocylindria bacterium]
MAAVTTIQRTETGSAVRRLTRRLGLALSAVGDHLAVWTAAHYEGRIAEELEGLPPERRIQAVLRWHARQSRGL